MILMGNLAGLTGLLIIVGNRRLGASGHARPPQHTLGGPHVNASRLPLRAFAFLERDSYMTRLIIAPPSSRSFRRRDAPGSFFAVPGSRWPSNSLNSAS